MRYIVIGAGAIGGTIGGRLAASGRARELAAASTCAERVAATAIGALDRREQRTLRALLDRVGR